MKKSRSMRLASALLVLTLLSTCMISGTFAKYVTKATGTDTARVAKWGVTVSAATDLFKASYDNADSVSVKADDNKDIIAPGTTGTAVVFTISGAPEVDAQVKITLNGVDGTTGDLTMVTLPKGEGYTDYTEAVTKNDGTTEYSKTFAVTDDDGYRPVKWTLTKKVNETVTTVVDAKNLNEVETYFAGLSKKYEVEETGEKAFSNIVGEYTLTWNWDFDDAGEGTYDAADTYLGQIAAEAVDAPIGYVANESFSFVISVTQVD